MNGLPRFGWRSSLGALLRESAHRALGSVLLVHASTDRIVVPSALRGDVRLGKQRSRACLASAASPSPRRRKQLEQAVHELLALTGRVVGADGQAFAADVRAGVACLRSAGMPARLRLALSKLEEVPGPEIAIHGDSLDLRELCEWIDDLLDERSERERTLTRWLPWLFAAAVLAVIGAAAVRGQNLAYGKTVTASSTCPLTPRPRFGGAPLSRVTDGVVLEGPAVGSDWAETNFAVCTKQEVHPWVTVDLGALHLINRVVVYNRSDCCWEDALPLSIQASTDNREFVTLETTEKPFTTEFPWTAHVHGTRARYLRLYVADDSARSIVLSEIEAYGR